MTTAPATSDTAAGQTPFSESISLASAIDTSAPSSSPQSKNDSAANERTAEEDPYFELRFFTEQFVEAQKFRMAQANRIRPGVGVVDPVHFEPALHFYEEAEKVLQKEMKRAFRAVVPEPIQEWVKNTPGLGEPSIARLLGIIGDPGSREHVRQLYAYCGVGEPSRKRRRGMSRKELAAAGNPDAKSALWNISDVIKRSRGKVKEFGPYQKLYEERRAQTEERVHNAPCPQCGKKNAPAEVGVPWRPGHQDADALRIVGKAILRDLWSIARGEVKTDE